MWAEDKNHAAPKWLSGCNLYHTNACWTPKVPFSFKWYEHSVLCSSMVHSTVWRLMHMRKRATCTGHTIGATVPLDTHTDLMQTWNIKVRINKTYLEVYCKLSVLFSVVLTLINKPLHDDIKSPRIRGGNCAQVWWYLEQCECRFMSYYSIVYKTLFVSAVFSSCLFFCCFKIAIWNDTAVELWCLGVILCV